MVIWCSEVRRIDMVCEGREGAGLVWARMWSRPSSVGASADGPAKTTCPPARLLWLAYLLLCACHVLACLGRPQLQARDGAVSLLQLLLCVG